MEGSSSSREGCLLSKFTYGSCRPSELQPVRAEDCGSPGQGGIASVTPARVGTCGRTTSDASMLPRRGTMQSPLHHQNLQDQSLSHHQNLKVRGLRLENMPGIGRSCTVRASSRLAAQRYRPRHRGAPWRMRSRVQSEMCASRVKSGTSRQRIGCMGCVTRGTTRRRRTSCWASRLGQCMASKPSLVPEAKPCTRTPLHMHYTGPGRGRTGALLACDRIDIPLSVEQFTEDAQLEYRETVAASSRSLPNF